MGGRYFYINDDGDLWSPGWSPVKKELRVMNADTEWVIRRLKEREMAISAEVTFLFL